MEVITIQSEAFQELVKKMDEIQTKLTAKEKEPKEICDVFNSNRVTN